MPPTSHRRGTALVEFALVTPLLLVMLAGALNFTLSLRTANSVAAAARAGAQYGSRGTTNATDTAGIQAAAANCAPDVKNLTVTSARSCKCSDGTSVSCSGSCANGPLRIYIQVGARATSSNVFTYPGLGFSGSTSSQAVMRVQ